MVIRFCGDCRKPLGPEHVKFSHMEQFEVHGESYKRPKLTLFCPEAYGDGIGIYEVEMEDVNDHP